MACDLVKKPVPSPNMIIISPLIFFDDLDNLDNLRS